MSYTELMQSILEEIDRTLSTVNAETVEMLVDEIIKAENVFLVGVGRVLLSLKSFAKRLNHLGVRAYYVGEINEPAFKETDLLIVASRSGKTIFPLNIAQKAKSLGGRMVYIGSAMAGFLPESADLILSIPSYGINTDDLHYFSNQIMSSLFEQSILLLGDVICLQILNKKGLKSEDVCQFHANLE